MLNYFASGILKKSLNDAFDLLRFIISPHFPVNGGRRDIISLRVIKRC